MHHHRLLQLTCFALSCLTVLSLASFDRLKEGLDRESTGHGGALAALTHWSASRAYPAAEIPAGAFATAAARMYALRKPIGATAIVADVWTSIGPNNVGGRTLDVALNPDNPETIYAASASGGLWRSWTGGEGADAWHQVPTGFPVLGISSIAMDPRDTSVLYLGTGEVYGYQRALGGLVERGTRGTYGIGILKSTDAGRSWVKALDWSTDTQRGVQDVEVDPRDSRIVWAATTEGTYRSTDAGGSWTQVHTVQMTMCLLLDPDHSGTAIVACGNFGQAGSGIYRTTDAGVNWTKSTTGLPANWFGKISLARAPSKPEIVYASIGSLPAAFFTGTALCKSTDRGASWSVIAQDDFASYHGWYSHTVVAHARQADRLLVAGIDVWRMNSSGEALEQRSDWRHQYDGIVAPGDAEGDTDFVHADIHAFSRHPRDPNTVYLATDGGIFRTTDFGETFVSLNGGYRTAQFYNGFACAQTAASPAIGGLQDNGTLIYEGTTAWRRTMGGDGAMNALHPTIPGRMYASNQFGAHYRSTDGGNTWEELLPSDLWAAFVSPLIMCRSNPDILYAARQKVLKSTDAGDTWKEMNGGAVLDGNPVLAMAAAAGSSDTVYAATAPTRSRSRMFITADGGATWRNATGALPDRYPVDIALHPVDARIAYIVFSGFGVSHVWKTVDAGVTWDSISESLPDIPTTAIAIDPLYPDVLYVGNDLGVFLSRNDGTTWELWSDGLPEAIQAMDLVVVPSERKIRVATHGSGVYERPLAEPPVVSAGTPSGIPLFNIQSLSPQPASQVLHVRVQLPAGGAAGYSLYDAAGRLVSASDIDAGIAGTRQFHISTETLPNGLYYLRVVFGSAQRTKRFLVLR